MVDNKSVSMGSKVASSKIRVFLDSRNARPSIVTPLVDRWYEGADETANDHGLIELLRKGSTEIADGQ